MKFSHGLTSISVAIASSYWKMHLSFLNLSSLAPAPLALNRSQAAKMSSLYLICAMCITTYYSTTTSSFIYFAEQTINKCMCVGVVSMLLIKQIRNFQRTPNNLLQQAQNDAKTFPANVAHYQRHESNVRTMMPTKVPMYFEQSDKLCIEQHNCKICTSYRLSGRAIVLVLVQCIELDLAGIVSQYLY